MNEINVKGIGLINEDQIFKLFTNARKLRAENKILKEEIDTLKGDSL